MSESRVPQHRITLIVAIVALATVATLMILSLVLARDLRVGAGLRLGLVLIALASLIVLARDNRLLRRDLDQRRRVEEIIRASEAKFSGILEIAIDAIISLDESQRIVHFNRGAEQIFGWSAGEVTGQSLAMLLPPRFREGHATLVRGFGAGPESARAMGHRREIYGLRKNGEEFPAEASISKLELPHADRLFTVVLRDISERKRTERDEAFLSEAGRVLSTTLDFEDTLRGVATLGVPHLADAAVFVTRDVDGMPRCLTTVHADAAVTRALAELEAMGNDGATMAWMADVEPLGRRVADMTEEWLAVHVPDERQRELLTRTGVRSLLVLPLVAPGVEVGLLGLLRLGSRAPFDERDHELGLKAAMRAGLAISNARLYLTAQRATRARDEVLAIVSHDLRNPISAIAMCSRVLIASPPDEESGRLELVTAIYDATEWMNRLIADLLDVSSIEAGRLSVERGEHAVGPLIEQAVSMLQRVAEEKAITVETRLPDVLPTCECDDQRVVQVLTNLIGNAVKFADRGGRVVVSAVPSGDEVLVSVADNGPGIPAADLPHVFTRFYRSRRTARTKGTGLGLAIAEGIVRAHGGRIWVESTVGEGSTFHFTLPRSSAAGHRRDAGARELRIVS